MARLNLPCYAMQPVDAGAALAILAGMADRMGDLDAAGLRFRFTQDDRVRFRLPVEGQLDGADPSAVKALAQELYQKLAEANGTAVSRAARDPSEILDDALRVPQDVLAMVPFACPYLPEAEPPQGSPKLLLIDRHAPEADAATAAITRAGRNVRLATLDGSDGATRVIAAFYDDDIRDMALSAGLLASGRFSDAARMLVGHDTFSGRLFLPAEFAFPTPAESRLSDDVATLLDVVAPRDGAEEGEVSHLLIPARRAGSGQVTVYRLHETAAEAASDVFEGQRASDAEWAVAHVRLDPAPEAGEDLVRRIVAQEFRLGYRPRLDWLPRSMSEGANLEQLQEQLFELQAELDLLALDQSRQQRLLRFTDAQLGALVDGLRRVPKPLLDRADIRYGAHHADGRARPVHYLTYNMADLPLGQRMLEDYWRMETEDHPMIYHLDPHCADAAARHGARSRVFVPALTYLTPSLGDFGGDLDQTLKLMTGRWFTEVEELFTDEAAEPAILFAPATAAGFDLDVEYLDLARMQPVALQLPWINDYLQTRDSAVVDPEALEAMAAALYSGDVAVQITAQVDTALAEAERGWTAGLAEMKSGVTDAVGAFRGEVEAATGYLADGFEVLDAAARHISEMELRLRETSELLTAVDRLEYSMASMPREIAAERAAFLRRLSAELALSDRVFSETRDRLEALRRRIEDVRSWGRGG